MPKFFNTAGLCNPENHYMIDPLPRLREIDDLIHKELYFTIHAPRQTGKTTYLHALARKLNAEGNYVSLVVSFERAGYRSIAIEEAYRALRRSIYEAARLQLPETYHPVLPESVPQYDLKSYIGEWCIALSKPLVLLIDEIDALFDDTLIAVLRQLRDGYQSRPQYFPSSLALVGLRDVRDYKIRLRSDTESLGTASPFNVKAESLMLGNFSLEDTRELLLQHTRETGQEFTEEVIAEIFRLTIGQPWLVNALSNQIVSKILVNDYTLPITLETVNRAKIELILRRDTHLDSLADKLREERVKRVAQAIIRGDSIAFDIFDDDIVYLRDLGLIKPNPPIEFANPIYAEIIPRIMASPMYESIPKEIQPYGFVKTDGSLDMEKLFTDFQKFYRRNADVWLQRFEYRESAQHLLLMAFLQRVINAGGEIVREMALGNQRLDMLVRYKSFEYAIELKIRRDTYTLEDGQEQLARYLDKVGLDHGWLVIFDPRDLPWEQKLFMREIQYEGKRLIHVGL